ncbi:MAG TPA: peroxide stress protein YaaA [Burkholderiaceae bacterium]|nr:peroxide stress protein YaaA [Burkholderiaceae bacterium]
MLIVLSPAKSLDYETPPTTELHTQPDFIARSAQLVDILKAYSPAQIASLMRISDPLAQLNAERYAAWSPKFSRGNSKQALLAFNGDVYAGLQAATLSPAQLDYAQSHIRILSGLYGLLRPLDLMQPYRLEMGTRLANPAGRDLYAYWSETVTATLNQLLGERRAQVLVNLASEEYFKVVRRAQLGYPVITPVFEDWKNGKYKIISFYAKRARGLMARYAAIHHIARPQQLQEFAEEGYAFAADSSDATTWIFRRRLGA